MRLIRPVLGQITACGLCCSLAGTSLGQLCRRADTGLSLEGRWEIATTTTRCRKIDGNQGKVEQAGVPGWERISVRGSDEISVLTSVWRQHKPPLADRFIDALFQKRQACGNSSAVANVGADKQHNSCPTNLMTPSASGG